MDAPKTKIETTPSQETSTNTGIESTPVAETVPVSPAQPPADTTTKNQIDPVAPITITDEPRFAETVTKEEAADLASTDVDKADNDWISRVKNVIKEDEGEPYKEVEDAEQLNEDYMKDRFNVDVDAPIEEK